MSGDRFITDMFLLINSRGDAEANCEEAQSNIDILVAGVAEDERQLSFEMQLKECTKAFLKQLTPDVPLGDLDTSIQ